MFSDLEKRLPDPFFEFQILISVSRFREVLPDFFFEFQILISVPRFRKFLPDFVFEFQILISVPRFQKFLPDFVFEFQILISVPRFRKILSDFLFEVEYRRRPNDEQRNKPQFTLQFLTNNASYEVSIQTCSSFFPTKQTGILVCRKQGTML